MSITRTIAAAAAAAITLAGAGSASASTMVTKYDDTIVVRSGDEDNAVTVNQYSDRVVVVDERAPLHPGTGCSEGERGAVECRGSYALVKVSAGPGPDEVHVDSRTASVPTTIHGGLGDDALSAHAATSPTPSTPTTIYGDHGDDRIWGGAGPSFLLGGSGDDALLGGYGVDHLSGGPGADSLNGGPDHDRVFYLERGESIRVSFDGRPNDGSTYEGDNVLEVETAVGGDGNDVFVGDSSANTFQGGGGRDTIHGLEGDDRMSGGPGIDTVSYSERSVPVVARIDDHEPSGAEGERDRILEDVENLVGGTAGDTLIGHEDTAAANDLWGGEGHDALIGHGGADRLMGYEGDDRLLGLDGDDVLEGWSGDDLLYGYAGRDHLHGGLGNDAMYGMAGDDTLDSRDGTVYTDVVACGDGWGDIVYRDLRDRSSDCEIAGS